MLPLVNDCYNSIIPYVPGKPISETERELGITNCIKLASNENPLGPSPKAVEAVKAELDMLHDYPDGGSFYLKQKLSEKLKVTPDQLMIGHGSNEIINMLVHVCMRPNENMIYSEGSFIAYKLAAQAMGSEIKTVPLTADLRYDLDAIIKTINAQTKLLFIGNPNNPTGTYITKNELDAFLRAIPEQVMIVLDEAYFEYVTAKDYPNGLDYLNKRERIMVLRTFSKCYGLAGLRVGYGIANATLIDFLNRDRLPFNVNALAQAAALAALDDEEHVQKTCALNREEMQFLVPELEKRGFKVTPSQANFILVHVKDSGQKIFNELLHKGVIVRPMASYGFQHAVRITLGTHVQNQRLLQSLDSIACA